MSKDKLNNVVASVRQRLANIARTNGEDFNLLLTHYAIERFLYRLCKSDYKNQFILKGAMLFRIWSNQSYRPTRDLDLLANSMNPNIPLESLFEFVCNQSVEDDGITFDSKTLRSELIKEGQTYEGIRIHIECSLGQARISLQIDVSHGDAVIPKPIELAFPTILQFPEPHLFAYQKETVIAEKFQTMVVLGIANSRMKDFFDLWYLSKNFEFNGAILCQSIDATFQLRKTPIPTQIPISLTADFGDDPTKSKQWKAFVSKSKLDVEAEGLSEICTTLQKFLMPLVASISNQIKLNQNWIQPGIWKVNQTEQT